METVPVVCGRRTSVNMPCLAKPVVKVSKYCRASFSPAYWHGNKARERQWARLRRRVTGDVMVRVR